MIRRTLLAAGLFLSAGAAHADSIHLYSYDAADRETIRAAGPLTFTIKKGLLHTTVLNLRSTTAPATAYLKLSDQRVLGRGGLQAIAGAAAAGRTLYEVQPAEEGAALIAAFCPGSERAWMAFGPVRLNRDLEILVVGAPSSSAPPKLCRTLNFNFHGEWLSPPGRQINPRDLERRHYPNP